MVYIVHMYTLLTHIVCLYLISKFQHIFQTGITSSCMDKSIKLLIYICFQSFSNYSKGTKCHKCTSYVELFK